MRYSFQDWFFRVEFIRGEMTDDGDPVAQTIDDGSAGECHAVAINVDRVMERDLEMILRHEFEHALQRFMQRRNPTR
jgi:hypothetical protein